MRISQIEIKGFQCFDNEGVTITFDDLTTFVGPNASGKTAAMLALARMFGENSNQRQVVPGDFHLSAGEKLEDKPARELTIECRLVYPELEDGQDADLRGVPETFNQMVVTAPGEPPYSRIQLKAEWNEDGSPGGDIRQTISWITTSSNDPKIVENGNRRRLLPADRKLIRLVYVPAVRDPGSQVRTASTSSFGRLLQKLDLSSVDTDVETLLGNLNEKIAAIPGLGTINAGIGEAWESLYHGSLAREVKFGTGDGDVAELLKNLAPSFCPGADGRSLSVSELSDGLRSLFYFSLSIGFFRLEELIRQDATQYGFRPEATEELPALTVFAMEEPENHLSPHYLGQVVNKLAELASSVGAQVVMSSHSPSILGRVVPDKVRYFLGHEESKSTDVCKLDLPGDQTEEAFKFVREAVRGFPELYFTRLVILGEGPSEEIVLKRLFESSGVPLDNQFISIVPLGGRHVNHFWRLLHGLRIPFITLLDLDREKEGAGWGRVQYVRDQLCRRFASNPDKLTYACKDGRTGSLVNSQWDGLAQNAADDVAGMDGWLRHFANRFDVFFSAPLDLDFAMLEAFPEIYQSLTPDSGGPRVPEEESADYENAVRQRMLQVLVSDYKKPPAALGNTYTPEQQKLFVWYKYLFVDGSKPVNHMRALLKIKDEDLRSKAPQTLRNLIDRARRILTPGPGETKG